MNNNHNHLNNQTNENVNISVHKEYSINFDILRVSISHRKCCIIQQIQIQPVFVRKNPIIKIATNEILNYS
jgi:hypothetical protein